MADLSFISHLEPQSDFLIVTHDGPAIAKEMRTLGATAVVRSGYTLYIWNSRLGDLFLIGNGVLDGKFLTGPRRLRKIPSRLGAGGYILVNANPDCITIQPDLFGMSAVYYSDFLITNRLHLAGIITKKIDVDNALSSTYNTGGFSFSFNTFKTPVQGVNLLPAGSSVNVVQGRVKVVRANSGDEFNECEPDDYRTLIARGAQEVVENVTAVVEAGMPVFADITGGRDSRVVFGALVAAGLQHEVIFNTITNPTSPGLKADLEIGSGLVALYGGSYGERPPAVAYAEHSIEQNLQRRRSHLFGCYHWIQPSDVRPFQTVTKVPTIRMLGGGGELYREYWKPMLFTSINPDELGTGEAVRDMLFRHRGAPLGQKYLECYVEDLLTTFDELPGKTIGHKLDAHYLNFRNRFHFGARQSTAEAMSTINVALSPSLLAASRCLPSAERANGRVLFDVIRAFDEKLAYLPFDKPGDPTIISSPYHKPSNYDDQTLDLKPAVHLASEANSKRHHLRPRPPATSTWNFESILDSEIDNSAEILSDPLSGFSHIINSEMKSHIDWAKAHSPRNRSSLASKLRHIHPKRQPNLTHCAGYRASAMRDEAAVNGLHLKVRLSQVLSERTNAGLTAAAARGRKGGRPMAATPERVARARQLIATGLTVREAAARVKVGKSALYAALSRHSPSGLPLDFKIA